MISPDDALKIQMILIEKFGGTKGVRDMKSLESALMRPFQILTRKSYIPPQPKKQQQS